MFSGKESSATNPQALRRPTFSSPGTVAALALCSLLLGAVPSAGQVLTRSSTITRATTSPVIVTVNSVDDNAVVTVNGTIRMSKSFSNVPQSLDISSYLVPGTNTIAFELDNASQGWSYDWQVTADGTAAIADACAAWNLYPACMNDDHTTGLVYRHIVTLNWPVVSTITYPGNGATNADLSQPIQWTSVANFQAYYLYIGTTAAAKDLVDSGELQNTFYPAPYLPAGQILYARIWTKVGGIWRYADSTFTVAAASTPLHASSTVIRTTADPIVVIVKSVDDNATLTVNGTVRLTKSFSNTPQSVDITPYLFPGANTILFEVVNTSQGWSYNWQMAVDGTTVIKDKCAVWNTYPACLNDDQTTGLVYRHTVTLNSPSDIAPLVSAITYPAPGATNANLSNRIQWTSVASVQAYYLYVGTTLGAKDLVNTGELQQTSYLAAGLPSGQTLYARLWTKVAGVWRYTDSTFSAAVAVSMTAAITYPANGAVNADMSQPIQWTSVANVQAYYLYVGTTVGSKNLVDSHELQQTSYLVSNLPAGLTVYARIWTKVGGVWRYSDSTFGAAANLPLQRSSTITRSTTDPVIVTVNSVDDHATVTVNGVVRLTDMFSNTPQSVDITPYLVLGTNTILFEVVNTSQGWSYNWQLNADSTVVIADSCAAWNSYPACLNDDQTIGLVYRHTVTLNSVPH